MKKTLFAAAFVLAALSLKAIEPPENLSDIFDPYRQWMTRKRSIPVGDPRLAFYATVTNLWQQGRMSNVLAIAEQRLACNSNDIAGVILKVECDLNFVNLDTLSNSLQRAINCGNTITTPTYSSLYPFFKYCLEDFLDVYAEEYLPEEIEADRAKALLPKKTLLFEDDLLAACLDGLVTNYPAQPPSGAAPQGGGGQQ